MGNNVLKPSLRFKGFTETWEQRNIKELGKVFIGLVTTMTTSYTTEGTLLIRNSDIKENKFSFSDDPIFLESKFAQENASRMLKIGDVVTVHTGDVGTSAVISENEENSIGFATINTRPNQKIINPDYLSCFFNTDIHRNFAVNMSTGDGRTNYNLKEFNQVMVPLPNLSEQKQIASIILTINQLITLHQRKYDKLVNVKKAFLDKMFPKNGEVIPKLRFKGFTDAWEQRELCELAQITMGQSPNGINYTSNPKDYVLVQGNADMENGWVTPRVWTTQITKMAEPNDLIFSVRAPVGAVGKTQHKAVIGRGVASIRGNEFIFQELLRLNMNNHWKTISTGSTFDSINSTELRTTSIKAPQMDEQNKIGGFLKSVDSLITLHQRKYEKLQNIKKALLQKMFI